MRTSEIPRDQWIPWLDAFSKRHEGWIVELEVVGPQLGDQEEANALPLVGIGADVKSGESRIEISLGGRPDAHLTRIIERPTRVWAEESDEPVHEAIAVESADGTKTLLHFRHVDVGDALLPFR